MAFALSSSSLRAAERPFPERLMKYWTMRIPDPIPLGLTFLLAITRAMVLASFVNREVGGKVETVFTFWTQRSGREYFRLGCELFLGFASVCAIVTSGPTLTAIDMPAERTR
jgi:hypothetical protein